VTGTTGTVRTHHPECRISVTNVCTCRALMEAERRLSVLRSSWTPERKPSVSWIDRIPPMPVALSLFAAGAFIANVVNHL
jgi:hypothetical protein